MALCFENYLDPLHDKFLNTPLFGGASEKTLKLLKSLQNRVVRIRLNKIV